ncbi:MAG: lamin tail domain-containing protein [Planctomycetota bacterium]
MKFSLVLLIASAFLPCQSCLGGLFISEYIEGSGNNKAIELFNAGPTAFNLEKTELRFYFNGNTSAGTTLNLSGTVGSGDSFVIADDGAAQAILDVADQVFGSSFFNGDDAIELFDTDLGVLDSFGTIGTDPGSSWGTPSSMDNTLRRIRTVTSGDTNPSDLFDPVLEWVGAGKDVFSGLGSHTVVVPEPASAAIFGMLALGLFGHRRRSDG